MKIVLTKQLNKLQTTLVDFNDANSVTLHLRGLAGSLHESPAQVGTAHILEHLLINSKELKELREKIQNQGGKIMGITSRDDVLFIIRILKEDVDLGVEFLAKLFQLKHFNSADLETTKNLVCQEISGIKNNPEKMVGRLAYKILFPNTRMEKLNTGDLEDVANLELEQIEKYYATHYKLENFVLVACGDLSASIFENMVVSHFGLLKTSKESPTNNDIILQENQTRELQKIIFPNTKQAHVKIDYYAYKITAEKKYSAMILAHILDHAVKNKVRESTGLTYDINCDAIALRYFGILGIYFTTTPKNVDQVMSETTLVLTKALDFITGASVESAKSAILATILFYFDKISGRADYYSELTLHLDANVDHAKELAKIKAITIEEIKQIALEIFAQNPKITILTNS